MSSKSDSGNRRIAIGKIIGTHGLKGGARVYSWAESMDSFEKGTQLTAAAPGGDIVLTVQSAAPHKKGLLLTFKEVGHINTLEPLVGSELFVDRDDLPEPEDGSYYWVDIIGLRVETVDGVFLGMVDSIFPTGSNDVYVVKDGKKEILVPALASVLKEIDLDQGTMVVDLPEGLL
ncbi:ribosome maturation factor RimM [Desulfoluna spongiiphila]|uniref:Ribosome maturation factor RimM n=1 Tax=Desulfoluna spongiiphila TaxID=419481 RepID=A0A1G5GGX3_9BACT|nr:ribosome maturation factor RimM [Desulfoluna spongiiphila]SCY50549.1 16S rRNA processing protein RimM [Desulfoluna spongiiphila]